VTLGDLLQRAAVQKYHRVARQSDATAKKLDRKAKTALVQTKKTVDAIKAQASKIKALRSGKTRVRGDEFDVVGYVEALGAAPSAQAARPLALTATGPCFNCPSCGKRLCLTVHGTAEAVVGLSLHEMAMRAYEAERPGVVAKQQQADAEKAEKERKQAEADLRAAEYMPEPYRSALRAAAQAKLGTGATGPTAEQAELDREAAAAAADGTAL